MKHFSITNLTFFIIVTFFTFACNNEPSLPKPTAGTADFAGFEMTPLVGTSTQKAIKKDGDGKIIEEGFVEKGVKVGQWIIYNSDNGLPKNITNYVNGRRSGVIIDFNTRGQIDKMTSYTNELLDGIYTQYKFGRTVETLNYSNGKKDGVYKKYFNNKDVIQQEVSYKKDSLDGPFRYYNEAGEVVLEYEYKNGKKISGGAVK